MFSFIFVTHDKRLLENVAYIVYEIDDRKIKPASNSLGYYYKLIR